jgi:hypothetical protein
MLENLKEALLEFRDKVVSDARRELKSQNNQKVFVNTGFTDEYVYKTKLYMKNLQRFYKGVIWLFTSDTLPSEENSW